MDLGNTMFWMFLAATTVASLAFVAVAVWSAARLRESQETRRFDLRKQLVDAGHVDAGSLASLARYEHELGLRQARQKLLVAGFVILGTGVGTCLGFQLFGGSAWMLGFIPGRHRGLHADRGLPLCGQSESRAAALVGLPRLTAGFDSERAENRLKPCYFRRL